MKRLTGYVVCAALALAASCRPATPPDTAPQPSGLTDAHRAALADTIDRMVSQVLSGFEHPDFDAIFSVYERDNPLSFAENGLIFHDFETMAQAARDMGVGVTIRASLGERHVLVLDADVAVMTTIILGTTTTDAGAVSHSTEAWTGVFHRTARGWRIAASHESFPPVCGGVRQRPGPNH